MRIKKIFVLIFGTLVLNSCDKGGEDIRQIGDWEGRKVTQIYQNGNLNTYSRDSLLVVIKVDKSVEITSDGFVSQHEWDILGKNDQILLISYSVTQVGDTITSFENFDIVVNEKDYQEWWREQGTSVGDTTASNVWWRTDKYTLYRK